jgi:hypothetical protein
MKENTFLRQGDSPMTREEILDMQPGPELNIAVAEKVMGNRVVNDEILGYLERPAAPGPNDTIAAGCSSGPGASNCCNNCCGSTPDSSPGWGEVAPYSQDLPAAMVVVNKMTGMGFKDVMQWKDFGGGKYTVPEAICKAALIAVSERSNVRI